jgi:hypothetical protein
MDVSSSEQVQMAISCECCSEFPGSINCGEIFLAEDLLASQEGLCWMELLI